MRTARLLERISGVDERFEQLQHHVRTDPCLRHPLVQVHHVSDAQAEENKARKRFLSVWQDIEAVVFEDAAKFLRNLFPRKMEAVNIATHGVLPVRPMMLDIHHVAAVAFDVVRDETREYRASGCAFDPANAVFVNDFRCESPKVVVRESLRYSHLLFLGTLRRQEAVTTDGVETVRTCVSHVSRG